MRHISRALVGVVLIACSSHQLVAAEAGSRWWPFGHRDEAKVAQPPAVAPPSQSPLQTPRPHSALNPAQPSIAASPSLGQLSPPPADAADATAKEHWMLSSPKGKVSWPHLSMPQMPKKGLLAQRSEPETTRNSWVDKTPVAPKPSPLKPLSDGAHKVTKSTKAAWHKTVDALTPGEPEPPARGASSRIAKREAQPPLWKRMFGEKEEAQQPQTVPEWMAQQRVDRK